MEILPSIREADEQVLGDIYFGYFVPTVLRGRSDAFRQDLNNFLSGWIASALDSGFDSFLENQQDFGLASIGDFFRDRYFSKVLTVSPIESISDVWELFWGVWADILKNTTHEESDYTGLIHKAACIYLMFYLYHCQLNDDILSIPLAVETISICLDIATLVFERFCISTVLDIFYFLLYRRCIRVCVNDGLQYIPQDRLGRPLGMTINDENLDP
ncbi:hypothetical protein BaOVIS_009910 [Babesia ovis]|uniref:Uncharacterized protein n=1 Tax=Babesia ovis TaxID=5869 RepID=A0A9W5T974_BABOV|nr:hypothetical protein BaOVIS_009910 [Babesia ovis]